jgi:hypothetical protein
MAADEDKARGILRRVEDDQRSFANPADVRGAQIDERDPVEVWAKRVGRALGYGLLALLALNLATGWFF